MLENLRLWNKKEKPEETGTCIECGCSDGIPTWFQDSKNKWWKYMCIYCKQELKNEYSELHQYLARYVESKEKAE